MKSTVKYLILLSVLGLLISSCEDVIDVEIPEENLNLYAVEAKISTLDEPTVFLTKGLPVAVDQAFIGLSNAKVTLTDDAQPANTVRLVEDPDSIGYYIVPANQSYLGVSGREYTLTIEIENVTLTARDYLATVEPIDSIQVRPSTFGDSKFLAVSIYSQETQGLGNYYKWDIFVNDTLLSDVESLAFASDELVDGNYVDDAEIFVDFNDPERGYPRQLKYMDTVLVHQISISEFAYNFYYQMQQQSFGGGLFSVPPANIRSNFISSDGKDVLGIFTAQDVSVSNIVIIDDSVEDQLKK
jgi:hypothetical protein